MRLAVVGGGLGGLMVAVEAHRQGADVVVLEAGTEVGGVATTVTSGGYGLETAVAGLPGTHPHLGPILAAADADVVSRPRPATRFVSDGGRFRPLGPGLALARSVRSPTVALRVLAEPLVPRGGTEEETVAAFLGRRLGPVAGGHLGALAAAGVFAGDPEGLEVRSAFPSLVGLERAHGSLLRGVLRRRRQPSDPVVPERSMSALAGALAGVVTVRTGTRVTAITAAARGWTVAGERVDRVVLAVDPPTVADILGLDGAPSVPTVPVAVVGLGGPRAVMGDLVGFGGLTSARSGMATLGITFEDAPGRAPEGHRLLRCLLGGARTPDVVAAPDDEVVARAVEEASLLMGTTVAPSWSAVARAAIPQYVPGHGRAVADFEASLPAGVSVGGWWYRGVGVASLATDATRLVAVALSG